MKEHNSNGPGNPILGILPLAVIAIIYDQMALGGQYTTMVIEKYQQINTWLNTTMVQPQETMIVGNSVAGAGFTPWQIFNLIGFMIIVAIVAIAVTRGRGSRQVDSLVAKVASGKGTEKTTGQPAGVGSRQSRQQRSASKFRRLKEV